MFEYLQKAFEERNMGLGLWRFDPDFAKYRRDPRYLDLLRKMNWKVGPPAKKLLTETELALVRRVPSSAHSSQGRLQDLSSVMDPA